MQLYNVKKGSRVRLLEDAQVPPAGRTASKGTEYFFRSIDGMYSYCLSDDNVPVHLAAWTEVEVIE